MQSLEPQSVDMNDALGWFVQAAELLGRRVFAYTTSILLFFFILFALSRSSSQLSGLDAPMVVTSGLIVLSAFLFFLVLANFIVLTHWADRSERYNFKIFMHTFMPHQKVFFQMAVLSVSLGLFFWYMTVMFDPHKNVAETFNQLFAMLGSSDTIFWFVVKESAVFLYFALVAFLLFRTIFSFPLILFHQLSYQEAKNLSQKALLKNIRVLVNVMLIWILIFMLSIQLAPILAALLFPLFAAYLYVSFRHIFWRQGCNKAVKVLATKLAGAS